MRVLLVTQYYWPEDFAAGVYMRELAEGLAARGHDVEVLTGFPNYPEGRIRHPYRGRLFQTEERAGVRIVRTWFYPTSRSRGAALRGLTAVSFGASALLASRALTRPDIVLGFSPPPFMGLAALRFSRRMEAPLFLSVKDLFTESILASGMLRSRILERYLRRWESFLYRESDLLGVPTPDFLPAILSAGVPASRVTVLPDWADGDSIRPLPRETRLREEWGLTGSFVVLYAGSMGHSSDLMPVLRAAGCLREHPELRFVLVGEGIKRPPLERFARERSLSAVRFHELLPRERLGELLASADVALATLSPAAGRASTQGKLYSLLAAGRPVIAMAPAGSSIENILGQGDCGWFLPCGDHERLSELLRRLLVRPDELRVKGRKARMLFDESYSLPAALRRFEDAMGSLAGRRGPRS